MRRTGERERGMIKFPAQLWICIVWQHLLFSGQPPTTVGSSQRTYLTVGTLIVTDYQNCICLILKSL